MYRNETIVNTPFHIIKGLFHSFIHKQIHELHEINTPACVYNGHNIPKGIIFFSLFSIPFVSKLQIQSINQDEYQGRFLSLYNTAG